MSLKKQAVSGMVWTFGQQFTTQIISFSISIVLARILSPSDFGTIALFSVVISVASTLIDGGMASSLVRTKNINQSDLSTVFWFNIVVAIGIYILIFFLAPLIAHFYKMSILTTIIRVYCLVLIIDSFVTVQAVTFTRDLDFKTSFKIQLPSQIIGGLSGLLFAYNGFGVWSIVFFALIQNAISAIQFWFYSKWKPSFIFDKNKFTEHFGFGYRLTLSNLLSTIFNNIYTVIIGKMYSPAQLGYYNRADTLKQLPVNNLSAALNKVTFPLFAKIKDDNIKLKDVYKKLMKLVVFIITPIMCIMIISAEPLIRFLLTEKWLPAVPYLQILSITGILYPVHAYNLNILKVKGKTKIFLRLEIIKKILIAVILIVSLRYGIMGLIWGQVVNSVLAFFINTYYTGKILNYGSFQQFIDLLPTFLLSSVISLIFYGIDFFCLKGQTDLWRLLVIVLGFLTLYSGSVWFLKYKELFYIRELLKR